MQRVADGELDVAAVWGPFAGWVKTARCAAHHSTCQPHGQHHPLEFSLAWGVQNTDVVLKLKIDLALEEAKGEIEAILREYGVPLVRCSSCIVEGDLPSHGAFEEARAKTYEDRFTKPFHRRAPSATASPIRSSRASASRPGSRRASTSTPS